MYKGKTFIISGPSGVGKSTVLKELFQDRDDLYFSVSATTRPPRPGEIDGVHYHFTDVDEFRKMISEDAFLEYAEYVGNFYGIPEITPSNSCPKKFRIYCTFFSFSVSLSASSARRSKELVSIATSGRIFS